MSYATLLASEESLRSEYLAVLVPRRRLVDWTLFSGFVYTVDYDLGDIDSMEDGGVTMTAVSTTTPNAGEYYHDKTNGIIYLRSFQSSDPDTISIVCNYRIYVSTNDAYHYSTPTDDTTEIVYFEPFIAQSPQLKSTISDSLFGALPVQSSTIKLANGDHFFERHIYKSSFNKGSIKIYHWLDELTAANCALVYDGLMSDVSYDTDTISIKTTDRIDELNEEFRNEETSFFNLTDFPDCDPNQVGKPVRYVYGYVKGFVPTNIDYEQAAPTTSTNRNWVVMGEQTGINEINRTVGGGTHTTTRTYINFVEGIQAGDTIWIDSATDKYAEVTGVSISPAYLDHTAIAAPAVNGDIVKKSYVSRIEIIRSGVSYLCYYNRDYLPFAYAGGTHGFGFTNTMESNVGLPSVLTPSDIVSCTVYGRVNDLTAGGPSFGSNDIYANNLANPVMVIYDLLKRCLGIPESRINLEDLAALHTEIEDEGIGISIPSTKSSNFPTYKAIILEILQTSLLKIFIDNDQKWTLSRLKPLVGTADKTISSDDIIEGSFGYEFKYSDTVSDVIVEYLRQEVSPASTSGSIQSVTASSDVARYVHKIEKQKTFKSLHFRTSDAQTLANRLAYALGDRKGEIQLASNRKYFNSLIGDEYEIMREKLPNFVYKNGTQRSVSGSLQDITRTLSKTSVTLDDQKGIEDNSGTW